MAEQGKNSVNLLGRLGTDPEIRNTKDGKPVANFTLATSDSWKDNDNNPQQATEWHRIVVWGALAEKVVKPFLKKGSRIDLEGKLQTKEWEKDGQKHFTTEIVIDQFNGSILMLDSANSDAVNPEEMKKAS